MTPCDCDDCYERAWVRRMRAIAADLSYCPTCLAAPDVVALDLEDPSAGYEVTCRCDDSVLERRLEDVSDAWERTCRDRAEQTWVDARNEGLVSSWSR